MANTNRVPAGVPTGGEFATGARAENDDLATPATDDPQVTAMRAMMAALTPAQRAAVLSNENTKPMDATKAVELWEDTVGDSGKAPEDRELLDFANAVLASGRPAPVPTIGFTVDPDALASHVEEEAVRRGLVLRPRWREQLINNTSRRLQTFGLGNDDEMYDLFDQGVRDSVKETFDRYFNPPVNFNQ